ncbi:MAG: ATP-dependent DNA helicase [Arcobacter sp.]|uniref:ATP-dependent DNA helicase n=1 Tax=Arcobacter sp. TaxID=1872629 RepID=UPI003D0084FC
MNYTDKQKQAIKINDKNLRIIACAGSGKTGTLVGKIVYLLKDSGLELIPENIVAFTFTEKAAAELKNRTISQLDSIQDLATMYIGTVHGWCFNLLQNELYDYQNFSVLDEIKLKIFVDKYYDSIGMKKVIKISNEQYMKRFTDTSIFISLMNSIRELNLYDYAPTNLLNALDEYKKKLEEHKYFDFTMIMEKVIDKLDSDVNLRKHIKDTVKFLFVDEYQDINPIQNILIKKIQEISKCKVFVVGDDDQNIYQWRGSTNKYLIDFHEQYKPEEFFEVILDTNYRSSRGITELASILIQNNKERISNKEMKSAENQKFDYSEDILFNTYKNVEEENESIAKYIEGIKGIEFIEVNKKGNKVKRGLAYSDICILVRKWDKAESIVNKLKEHDIPYITGGVSQLFETPEIKASLGIFKYLHKDISKEELVELWLSIPNNCIKKEKLEYAIIGDETKSKKFLSNNYPELYSKEIIDSKTGEKKIIEDWAFNLQQIFWNFIDLAEIYENTIIASNDTTNSNIKTTEEIIFYNLGKFSQVINDFEEINFNSASPSYHLFSFLSFIRYVAVNYYPEGWINSGYKTPNAIQIMTIHQSKGLEFPVVIIPGMNRNYFPLKKKGGLSEKHFINEKTHKTFFDAIENTKKDENNEGERRLLYVAITRSKKYLFISRAPDINSRLYVQQSDFINELEKSKQIMVENDYYFDNKNKINSQPKEEEQTIQFDFTILKDFFDCPYKFKLVSLYGFCYPLDIRMGMGKSFHNCLMELHKRVKNEDEFNNENEIKNIVNRQYYFPYMGESKKLKQMEKIVEDGIIEYYRKNKDELKNIVFAEQEIQYQIDDNILVSGRVDLIRQKIEDDKEITTIVEFKSSDDVQGRELTNDQLFMYALGYKELKNKLPDYTLTYIIDENREKTPRKLHEKDLEHIKNKIKDSANKIRKEKFEQLSIDQKKQCGFCIQNRLCSKTLEYGVKSNR